MGATEVVAGSAIHYGASRTDADDLERLLGKPSKNPNKETTRSSPEPMAANRNQKKESSGEVPNVENT